MNVTTRQQLLFTKTRDVKCPNRGTERSAGIDFYVPNDFEEVAIAPNSDILIPAGVKVIVPQEFALIAFNKSGISTKRKLDVGACVVDEDYRGEVHIHLFNNSDVPVIISPGDKIVQFLLLPVNYTGTQEVTSDDYESLGTTERGSGGFGSTDRKETSQHLGPL